MFWYIFSELCEKINKKPNPVASELKISSGAVTQWKAGSIPSAKHLIKISDYFGVSIDYLLGRSEPAALVLDPESKEILNMYGSLTPEQQNFIKITIQGLLSSNEAAVLEKKKNA